jgi:repressor LexA
VNTIGKRIREIRKNRRLSLRRLAKMCGISYQVIQALETAEDYNPHVKTIEVIAKALLVSPAYILGYTDTTHMHKNIDEIIREQNNG